MRIWYIQNYVLQCVAVCCSMCCSVLQHTATHCIHVYIMRISYIYIYRNMQQIPENLAEGRGRSSIGITLEWLVLYMYIYLYIYTMCILYIYEYLLGQKKKNSRESRSTMWRILNKCCARMVVDRYICMYRWIHVMLILYTCYTATHCNTLQHTATHCNTLQHTATHCNTLQHTATHCNTRHHM